MTPARARPAGVHRLERRDPALIVHPADAGQARDIVRHVEISGGSRALDSHIQRPSDAALK